MGRLAALRAVIWDDDGVSLVEAIVAIAILGIASTGLMWGLLGFVVESNRVEQRAEANRVLIEFTEALRVQAAYEALPCPAPQGETSTPYDATGALLEAWDVILPAGWDASTIEVIAPIRHWDPDLEAFAPLPAGDSADEVLQCTRLLRAQLQEVSVRVTSPDGRATAALAVVKRGGS